MMGNEMMAGRKDDGGAVPALEVFGSVRRTRGASAGEVPAREVCAREAPRASGGLWGRAACEVSACEAPVCDADAAETPEGESPVSEVFACEAVASDERTSQQLASEMSAGEDIAPRGSGLTSDSDACGLFDPSLAARPVVLFDFDGTLANTQPAIMRVVSEVLARRDISLTEAQVLPLIGPPLEDGIRLVANVSEDEALRIAAEYRDLFARTVTAADIPLFPGTAALLDALAAAGKRIAVATSRLEASTAELVRDLGVTHFEAVRGRVPGVRQTKAESIAAALAALDVRPTDAGHGGRVACMTCWAPRSWVFPASASTRAPLRRVSTRRRARRGVLRHVRRRARAGRLNAAILSWMPGV